MKRCSPQEWHTADPSSASAAAAAAAEAQAALDPYGDESDSSTRADCEHFFFRFLGVGRACRVQHSSTGGISPLPFQQPS